jgi:monoamine oxidase
VKVVANDPNGDILFRGHAAVITLPLGVLKSGTVAFDPPLSEKDDVIQRLEFGNVQKVVLRFHHVFWPEPNFGFIHNLDAPIPTWWADDRGPVLTGWAGGPKADKLASTSRPAH